MYLSYLVAVEDERRHGGDALDGGRLLALVDVDLQEHRLHVFGGQLLEDGSYPLTGTAPASATTTVVILNLCESDFIHYLPTGSEIGDY